MLRTMSDVTQTMQSLAVEAFLGRDFVKAQRVMKLMTCVRNLDDRLSLRILNHPKGVRRAVSEMLIAREIRRIAGYSVAMADATANRVLSSDADAGSGMAPPGHEGSPTGSFGPGGKRGLKSPHDVDGS